MNQSIGFRVGTMKEIIQDSASNKLALRVKGCELHVLLNLQRATDRIQIPYDQVRLHEVSGLCPAQEAAKVSTHRGWRHKILEATKMNLSEK